MGTRVFHRNQKTFDLTLWLSSHSSHVVSARFCRCHGAIAIRFNERVSTGVIRDGQSKDHGARRSGVSLGLRGPGGELVRDNLLTVRVESKKLL